MFTTRRSSLYSNVTKKVTQARKGLGTNSVGLATELSLVSKLLQKVIPKKISANGARSKNVDKKLGRERRRVVLKSDLVERNYQELWRNYEETKRPND